jgi:arylsulfatase A
MAAALFAASANGEVVTQTSAVKTNIVIILADDFGYGSAGCYGADSKLVRTPHIDRLAREGRRFTDASTPSSVCSPTRYGMLTGRYCWRTSLKNKVLNANDPLHIETNRTTIASLLQSQGYATAAIGKWHLGYGSKKPVDFTAKLSPGPLDIGFGYHFGVPSNHGDYTGVYVENWGVAGLRSAKLTPSGRNYYSGGPFLGLDAPQREDTTVMETLTDKAVAWIGEQKRDKPFFLYFTPVAAHEPVTPSVHTKGTSEAGPYGDWLHEIDRSVGRILETLDKQEIANDTLILFTSDNGGDNKETRGGTQAAAMKAGLRINGPWHGGKHSIYEGGFRVPYLIRWPGHVPAGTVCDEMINLTDTLATITALVGAERAGEDSFNVLPAWLGKEHDQPLRPSMILHSSDGVFAVRQGPWKWIEGKPSKPSSAKNRRTESKPQLYNLRKDPAEKRDVLAQNPDVARQLSELLKRCRKTGTSQP